MLSFHIRTYVLYYTELLFYVKGLAGGADSFYHFLTKTT